MLLIALRPFCHWSLKSLGLLLTLMVLPCSVCQRSMKNLGHCLAKPCHTLATVATLGWVNKMVIFILIGILWLHLNATPKLYLNLQMKLLC